VSQFTGAARLHAEGRLAEATQKLETAALKEMSAGEVRPGVFLLVATRLIEAGGLANYVRSAAVSDAFIDQTRWVPSPHAEPLIANRVAADRWAPLSWLIPAWVAVGVAGAALSWWLQYDRPLIVGAIWAGGLVVLAGSAVWLRMRSS